MNNVLILLALITLIFSAFGKCPLWVPLLIVLFYLGAAGFFR